MVELPPYRVLVVDDEPDICELVREILAPHYTVKTASNGQQCLQEVETFKPDLIIMDYMMPGHNGREVSKLLRQDERYNLVPILMLTAHDNSVNRMQAFEAGVDDFIGKPFHPDELLLRVKVKLQRTYATAVAQSKAPLRVGDLALDFEHITCKRNEQNLELRSVEFKILACLARNYGKVVPRNVIEETVWQDEKPSDRALDPHILSLRKKIHESQVDIRTIYGEGFCLTARPQLG